MENHKYLEVKKYYSPENEFYAFDILINKESYLNVEFINKIFK